MFLARAARQLVSTAPREFVLLDLLRGMSALFVLMSHARSSIFVDFGQVSNPSVLDRGWYFVTGLSGEAVLLFFVLSGFFIAKSVMDAVRRGRWSWRWYFVQRVTRLEVVLIPALVCTYCLDYAGLNWTPWPDVYSPDAPSRLAGASNAGQSGWFGFWGNLLFLQTIMVAPFGSNGSLWSLANEFWYYVIFPLLFFSLHSSLGIGARILLVALALLLLVFVGSHIALLFPAWLTGVGAYLLYPVFLAWRPRTAAWATGVLAVAFVAFLALGRMRTGFLPGGPSGALILACVAALLIAVAARYAHFGGRVVTRLIHALADRSYSLYALHLPVVMILAASFWGTHRLQPDGVAFAFFVGTVVCVGFITEIFYRCFERNTADVRHWLWTLLHLSGRSAPTR